MSDKCREIVEIILRSEQRIDSRNHGLWYKHQLKAERAADVDQRCRARGTASGFYLTVAGTRDTRQAGNLLLGQLLAFTRSLQQMPDLQQGL